MNAIPLNLILSHEMSQYFPNPYGRYNKDISVNSDLSSYATKADLKGATRVDTFNLASKSILAKLKAKVDKIEIERIKTVPVDLSKLSNIMNNEVVKKTVYYKLVEKVNSNLSKINNIDTSGFVLKTKNWLIKSRKENQWHWRKIPDISRLV